MCRASVKVGWILASYLYCRQDAKGTKKKNKLVKTAVILIDI